MRRPIVTLVVVALIALGVSATVAARDPGDDVVAPTATLLDADANPSLRLVGRWPAPPPTFLVADAAGDSVDLYEEPGERWEDDLTLPNPTHEGLPLVFRVLEDGDEWLHVQVSMRPNETTAWIRRDQVGLRIVENVIEVELSTRAVRVVRGENVLWEAESVIGREQTPTPLGTFFVDGWVPLEGNGSYGAGQLSVAGFSEVLHSFGGGIGQIAIHGTNRPDLIGTEASNGCVRLENDQLLELVEFAPLGTPVVIMA